MRVAEQATAPRRRGRETGLDMVRTLAVIIGAVAVLLLLVPASPRVTQPGPDPVAAAATVQSDLGFAPAVVAPGDLGTGWTTRYARAETAAGLRQWRLGYLSPDERLVDVQQARSATVGWLTRDEALPAISGAPADLDAVLGRRGGAVEVTIGRQSWWQFERGDGTVALAVALGETVVVVSGTSQRVLPDMEQVAAALTTGGVTSG